MFAKEKGQTRTFIGYFSWFMGKINSVHALFCLANDLLTSGEHLLDNVGVEIPAWDGCGCRSTDRQLWARGDVIGRQGGDIGNRGIEDCGQ